MLKMQPLGIFTDSTDHYRVRFEGKNGVLEYTFSVVWTGDVGVLNCDQREFFFDTHDDPAAKLLLKAIDMFDEARRCKALNPFSVMVDGQGPAEKYTVVYQNETGEKSEGSFSVDSSNGLDLVKCETAFLKNTNGDPGGDRLKECISSLHKARHFQYVTEKNAAAGPS
jgi:hypothetical protein